jgi:hypothetical protein
VIADIVSLAGYESQASALLNEQDRMAMEFYIACAGRSSGHPGRRRLSQGSKSGGFRVIYFFLAEPGRIYMAGIYAKSRKETLSAADRNVLAKLAASIKKAAKGGRY